MAATYDLTTRSTVPSPYTTSVDSTTFGCNPTHIWLQPDKTAQRERQQAQAQTSSL